VKTLPLTFLAALALVPAATPAPAPVLGIEWNGAHSRLAWFDPQTLRMLPGRKAPLAWHNGSWSFSTDRSALAIGGNGVELRFVDARRMRVLGDLKLAPGGTPTAGVTWLRPDRLLALVERPGSAAIVAVDPARRRVVRRTTVSGQLSGYARVADGLALLLAPEHGIGPARVAVVDADAAVRAAAVDRIAIGSSRQAESGRPVRQRSAGFAVDPASGTAWVVGADAFAEVDLHSLAVAYRSSPRQLAKALEGPARWARWLGGGLIAVSGADWSTDAAGKTHVDPYGLRLVAVAAGTSRTIDPQATLFDVANGLLLVRQGDDETVAYDRDGAIRYRVALSADTWLNTAGGTGLVCAQRNLVAVVDLASGARSAAAPGRICPDLLAGSSAGY
jgi:hypothetical protein